jgi:hypothetical protein
MSLPELCWSILQELRKKITKHFSFRFKKRRLHQKIYPLRIQEKKKDKTETGSRWHVTPCNKPDYRKRALLNVMMDRLGSQENWVGNILSSSIYLPITAYEIVIALLIVIILFFPGPSL